jgi:uncharacterized protein
LRLTPEKVRQLADLVVHSLEQNPEVELRAKPDELRAVVAGIITDDLKEEEAIEAEARKKLELHRDQIKRSGANFDEMLRKMIRKEAQDRGFTL